jgi:hypothetical protein
MKMTDMGRKFDEPSVVSGGEDETYYPSIYLDKKQMKAAGLSGAQVGAEMQMVAKVRVRSVSDSVSGGGSIDLEIVEAGFGDVPGDSDRAAILYGDD